LNLSQAIKRRRRRWSEKNSTKDIDGNPIIKKISFSKRERAASESEI
jgi:hypothetical protein